MHLTKELSPLCVLVHKGCAFEDHQFKQGSHPTRNFAIFFSRPGKCLKFAQKVEKTWNFNSKP